MIGYSLESTRIAVDLSQQNWTIICSIIVPKLHANIVKQTQKCPFLHCNSRKLRLIFQMIENIWPFQFVHFYLPLNEQFLPLFFSCVFNTEGNAFGNANFIAWKKKCWSLVNASFSFQVSTATNWFMWCSYVEWTNQASKQAESVLHSKPISDEINDTHGVCVCSACRYVVLYAYRAEPIVRSLPVSHPI